MRRLEEWEHHVAKVAPVRPTRKTTGKPGQAYCGSVLWSTDWHFTDDVHARLTVEQKQRLQPCPECWEAMSVTGRSK